MIELGVSSGADLAIHLVLLSVLQLADLRAHVMELLMELCLEIDSVNSLGDRLEPGLATLMVIWMAPRLVLLSDSLWAPRWAIY